MAEYPTFVRQLAADNDEARPGWTEYFMDIAAAVAQRGDCVRDQVGAVLVKGRRVVSTGYNGVRAGDTGCLTSPCDRVGKALRGEAICPGYSDCRSVHAEGNVLLYANAEDCRGATLYITRRPCLSCSKLIRSAGVAYAIYPGADGRTVMESF